MCVTTCERRKQRTRISTASGPNWAMGMSNHSPETSFGTVNSGLTANDVRADLNQFTDLE